MKKGKSGKKGMPSSVAPAGRTASTRPAAYPSADSARTFCAPEKVCVPFPTFPKRVNLRFEPATTQDADRLTAVQNAAFADDLQRYGECPSYIESRDAMVEKIRAAVFYKILMGDAIVGGIEVYRRTETHYHLYMLCVDPTLHDRGIGTKALEFLFARHPEAVLWTLVTPADNKRSRHLYEKLGFTNAGERIVSDSLTLIRYEKNCTNTCTSLSGPVTVADLSAVDVVPSGNR